MGSCAVWRWPPGASPAAIPGAAVGTILFRTSAGLAGLPWTVTAEGPEQRHSPRLYRNTAGDRCRRRTPLPTYHAMTQIRTFHARLDTLLGNAKSADPADVADFDWARAGRITSPSARDFLSKTVNRLYYGELATAAACTALVPRMDDLLVREFLEHQAADEERHARIYRQYMDRLGTTPVEEPVSAEILGAVSVWRGHPAAVVAGLNIALEGAAMEIQLKLAKDAACPVFADINRMVARDEARHLAFGKIYLSEISPQLDRRDREWIVTWLRAIWLRASEHAFRDLPGAKALPVLVRRHIVKRGWRRTRQALADVGLAA